MYTQNEQEMTEPTALAIGQALRQARENSDFSIQDIADLTRLSTAHLSALEAGDFERLPGVGYIPGYIRNYCQAIRVDAAPHIASFKALSSEVAKKPEYSFPVQALVPRVAGSLVAMFTVLVGLAVYIGWTVLSYNKTPDDELIASSISQFEQTAVLVETEPEAAGRSAAESVIAAPPADQAPTLQLGPVKSDAKTQTEIAFSQSGQPTVQAETAPAANAPEAASLAQGFQKALPTVNSPAGSTPPPITDLSAEPAPRSVAALATPRMPENEVIIRATASAWIEVTRADGEVLITKLMRNGDQLVLPASDELFLSTGNAGGLRLEMLNMTAFDAGQTGEILRDLRLSRETLITRQTQLTY